MIDNFRGDEGGVVQPWRPGLLSSAMRPLALAQRAAGGPAAGVDAAGHALRQAELLSRVGSSDAAAAAAAAIQKRAQEYLVAAAARTARKKERRA